MTYAWDAARQQFRDARGRFVAATTPQQELTKALTKVGLKTDRLASQLREGKLTLDQWRVEMQTIIKQVHAGGAALARGGFANLTAEDVTRVEKRIMVEYQYLEAWTQDLSAGAAPMDGTLASRARLYVNQGRVAYHTERHQAVQDAGFNEVRSVLHPAEHCEVCIEQAEAGPDGDGWQSVEIFIPIGARTCLSNDRCTVEYRRIIRG
jgi:hypothetical protein